MKTLLKILYSVLCVLGCLLGAGFISGAEVQTFFVTFGWWGLGGIVLSSVIFSVAVCKYSGAVATGNIGNNRFNFLPYCQMFISGAMLAGLASVLANMLNINYYITLLACGLLLFVSLFFGIKVANIFNIIVSLCTIIILPIVVKSIGLKSINISSNFKLFSSTIYAVLYSIINIVACMPIIKNVSKKHGKAVAIISGTVTCTLLCVIFVLLCANTTSSDMPILSLLTSGTLKVIYTVLFVVAMLSTMLSASSGAKQIFAKLDNNILESLCACLAIISVSFVGFGGIIKYMYPTIGIAFFAQKILNKLHKRHQKTQFITN